MKKIALLLSIVTLSSIIASEIPVSEKDIKYKYEKSKDVCVKTPDMDVKNILSMINAGALIAVNQYEVQGGLVILLKSKLSSNVLVMSTSYTACNEAKDILNAK